VARLAREFSRSSEEGQDDILWGNLQQEAREALEAAPMLRGLFCDAILSQESFEAAVYYRVAQRLRNEAVNEHVLLEAFRRALETDPEIGVAIRADILAVLDRDPACERLIEPLLYFKGFHAIQTHRAAHQLWRLGSRDFAFYLQSRSSEVFQADIHPNVPVGRGVFLDHATGLVVGETAEIGDNVSMLQGVTLGGTGKETADRHPKIREGVMIGAGAKILGNIVVGEYARVAAGSVVLKPVPSRATVAGVPAKLIKLDGSAEQAKRLDQILSDVPLTYESFDFGI
jgi:serine O-acetyltransferase